MGTWLPELEPLAHWLGTEPAEHHDDRDELADRDARLAADRAVLQHAEELVVATTARHRPSASGPAAAVELDLLAARLSAEAGEDRAVLERAAVLCAGDDWGRLAALLPTLRNRVARVSEELAEVAVRAARLERRSGPALAAVTSLSEQAFAAEAAALDDELRRHTTRIGADSAYVAADATFLPSLADFLS